MKKFFTLLTAFVLSLTVANAQNEVGAIKEVNAKLDKIAAPQTNEPKMLKAKSTPNKIEMEKGEHLLGFYMTDDLPDFTWGGYGITSVPGLMKAGVIFDDDVLGMFRGGEITKVRFAIASLPEVTGFYIYEVSTNYKVSEEPLVYVDLSDYEAQIGWNEITLPEPITIEEDKYYLMAYEYVQTDTYENESYPLAVDADLDVDVTPTYGFILYADWTGYDYYGVGAEWISMGSYYGSICIQAVVKGGQFIDDDITLKNLTASKFAPLEGDLSYNYYIYNNGNEMPTSYSLNVCIDGNVVETLENPVELKSSKQKVTASVTLPSTVEGGDHILSIEVASINGNVPTENIDDDVIESSFNVYEGAVDRQMNLIEQFTSVQCGWCPLGTAVLQTMEDNNPGKYAWVAIHCSGMGDDPFWLTDGSADYIETYSGVTGYPSASFNRYLYDPSDVGDGTTIAMGIGYYDYYTETAAELFDDLVNSVYDDLPAFAPVDIETDYDETTRQLTIKVSGEGVTNASDILDGQRLTVYLTEDNIVSMQLNYMVDGYEVDDYVHNHVLRAILSNEGYSWGDELNWMSDGQTYENDYVTTLDDSWVPENMHVVAFICKSFAYDLIPPYGWWYYSDSDEGYVNNANMAKVSEASTSISRSVSDTNATEVARYTMDGRQLSSPAKGLNIVKMSDGTTRKVIVR